MLLDATLPVRRKDAPRIAGLTEAIASGAAATLFTEQDCQVFGSFMLARKRRYPVFFAAKHTWVVLVDTLPPGVSQALNHHVQLRANQVFRMINRRQCRGPAAPSGQGDARNSLAHSPR